MRRLFKKTQKGFTVIELMVSTVIFSLILLGAMAALIQVGRLYYKGITTAKTQEQARSIVTELSQSIQFSSQDVTPATPLITGPEIALELDVNDDANAVTSFICVGPRRYTFAIDRKLSFNPDQNVVVADRAKEIRHVLWVDEPDGGCTQGANPLPADLTRENPCDRADTDPADTYDDCSNGRELMAEFMRLSEFSITQTGETFEIRLGIARGDDDLLDVQAGRYVCEGSRIGGEFCAISELSTTVLKRI